MTAGMGTAPNRSQGPDIPYDEHQDTPLLFAWQRALRDSGLPAPTRHVALALSTYMDADGGSAFPGATRLAHDTGKTLRRVREHLGQLVEAGWLKIVERGGLRGEKRRANRYQAVIPNDPCDDVTGALMSPVPLTNETPDPCAGVTPPPKDQPNNQPNGKGLPQKKIPWLGTTNS